jgi:hypothetical protein
MSHPKSDPYGSEFQDDFRDKALKVNDDRKIIINLNKLGDKASMVLLIIDNINEKLPASMFERAHCRLFAEETNQTIDICKIIDLKQPEAEGGEEGGEEGSAPVGKT